MTEGPVLIHDGRGGIWRRFLAGGRINAAPWHNALAIGEVVGTCTCGGYLRPGAPYWQGRIQWFPATCTRCGEDVASRGPSPTKKKRPTR